MRAFARNAGVLGLAAAVSLLSMKPNGDAYAKLGFNLGTTQRDFRIRNNFTDSQANNNTTPHYNFPGATGAMMANWKGAVEWESRSYNDGKGDGVSSNSNLGDGGADFDWTFQGEASSNGGLNDNIISSQGSGCGGGVLAFTESPGSNGWRIKFCESWTWQDGPGSFSGSNSIDIQGVACHELGHALGLSHSNSSGATMYWAISGNGTAARSLHSDDSAGVQSIYSVAGSDKVEITSIAGSTAIGGSLTVNGKNFSGSGNAVWFTKNNSNGVATKVTGLSSSGGGTTITVTVPSGIQDGSINVQSNASGHKSLSNSWPFEIGSGTPPPSISSVSPTSGNKGTTVSLTVNGSGFSSGAQVKITMGASTINATGESLTGSTVITCSLDLNSASTGTYDVTVTNSDTQSGTKSNAFTVNQGADPAPVILSINPTSADAGQVIPFTLFGIDLGQGAQMTLEMGATVIEAASESVTGVSIMNGTIDLTSAPDGLYDVVVTNPDGQSGSLVDGFDVDNPFPPGTAVISAASPDPMPVLTSPLTLVTLTGSGFSTATKVTVDGQFVIEGFGELFVLGDTSLQFFMPIVDHLGAVPVTVTNSVGTSAPFNLTVAAATSPVLWTHGPVVFTQQDFTWAVASDPGDIHFMWTAWSNQPTPVPGLVNLDIGAFGTALMLWTALPANAAGITTQTFTIPADSTILGTYWWQAAVLTPTWDLPAPVTNVSMSAILF